MTEDIKNTVRKRYARAAGRVTEGHDPGVSASEGCGSGGESACCNTVSTNLYSESETTALPAHAVLASLGCGNPTALADLRPGETVLDLGSGGGIDVLLSARRVGPNGKAIGLDMTDEMLSLARRNQMEAGVENVEFLTGDIENVPLPDASVDVIISNCVINLSSDKPRAMAEAYRVLKPGGRLAISDIVTQGEIPARVRESMELWTGCIAGALDTEEFKKILGAVGFEGVSIEPTRVYGFEDAKQFLGATENAEQLARRVDGRFAGAFVRATKPVN